MAETVVSFVAEKLCNLLLEEAIFLHGVQDQVGWMSREMRRMRAFLQDADTKQNVDMRSIANLVKEIREVAYDAEDAVDTHILQMHRQRKRGLIGFIKRYVCILRELYVCHKTGLQIERIKSRLQEVSESKEKYGIDVSASIQGSSTVGRLVNERRESAIQRDMNISVGFDEDVQQILEVLLDEKKVRRSVLSIVGMGGSGKTTLARRIYDNDKIRAAFGRCRVMVSVSQNYDVSRILIDIAKTCLEKTEELQGMDEKERREVLYGFLESNKYLVILDDVWGTEAWGLIQPHLPDAKNGSRVVITTRSLGVAMLADPSIPPYELRLLSDDESWDLFTRIVFPGEDATRVCTGELKVLAEKFIKDCGGLPLAVAVMAGFLSTKQRTPIKWQEVLQGIDWENIPDGETCMKILALSYRDLPHYLKPCFLYLSCFPEDHKIDVDKLVRLWVAEGLVPLEGTTKYRNGGRTMEDIAADWVEELIQRCLLQGVVWHMSGRVAECQVHDLLLNLSIKEAEEAEFFHTCRAAEHQSPPVSTRRLALLPGGEKGYMSQEFSTPKLRTLLAFFSPDSPSKEAIKSVQFLKWVELLRVLDLENAVCRELPTAIGGLIHLRYLGLRGNALKSIPSSIGKLRNLQTLDAMENYDMKELPESVWGITTLRHVFIDGNIKPHTIMVKDLVNLQTIYKVTAGSWIKNLATMSNLRRLEIYGILPDHHLALASSLDCLLHLRVLALEGAAAEGPLPRKALALPNHRHLQQLTLSGPLGDPEKNGAPNYTSEELPPNLNNLVLYYSKLPQDPLSLFEKLQYLKFLTVDINSYVGEEVVCSSGGFPQLVMLELSALGIREWRVEEGAMPQLQALLIKECSKLEMLPDGLQHLKNLQSLHTRMMSDEFLRRLREDEGGQDRYKIQHIPYVHIDKSLEPGIN